MALTGDQKIDRYPVDSELIPVTVDGKHEIFS